MKIPKKVTATIVAALITIFGKQLGFSEDTISEIIAVAIAFIVGQGIADLGKERAKIEKVH